ncbi:MAG: hypothetical protein LBR81_04835 [Prevotellaceae bacterium]|jgi:hypothetical protein|nr:hypothetical protein [Prevotellaceae bacterium]
MDCIVPRNDALYCPRHCEEARRSNRNTGMDCFVPRNDEHNEMRHYSRWS